jgi:hypothetical protein
MSKRHRKPTASAKIVAKIAFTAAGSQRADHAGGRSAGARGGSPLNAVPVTAQYIVRAGVLAFALGAGAAVANTPGVAFAEPTDTSSSSSRSSSDSSSSASSSSSESAASTSATDPTSSTDSSAAGAGSSSGSTSGVVQSSVDAQASSTSSPRHASTADPRSGIKKSSGGAHTGPTPSSSDTTASAGATPTQTGVPSAVATAAPAEPPTAAWPTQQPTAASPTEQPAAQKTSAEPVPSPDAREAATPETPVATAAAPKTDAPHGESHTAPNSAGSDPTNRSGSASSTSANQQSTVVVQAAATSASTAQPRTATQTAVESVTSTFSAVEGALETRAVPKAFSAPVAPPDVVSGVVLNALASVGLSPSVSNNPLGPVDSPAELAVLAWARRQNQQTLYRPIDGTNVDVRDPSENAAGTDFIRLGSAHFVGDDGLRFADLNPRMISNVVVGQGDPTIPMPENFSGMMYAWGQFLDHDLDLAPQDGKRAIDIKVPDGDPVFGDGASIAMTRAVVDENSGIAINSVTGWLDGSQVYGSTAAVAASLRGSGGHLRVENNSLPVVNEQFLAGDVRAAENPSLTALQVLFVREHNWQVDRLHDAHPHWGEDKLYEEARAIVTAELANITYSEFLPKLIGDRIDPYTGYKAKVDATISVEFAGAAFRFGHSIVSGDTERIDNDGNVAEGDAEIPLREAFFMAPDDFNAFGGADGFLRHLAAEASQTMDVRIVEDLRNFLFDPPVGMDLAAINIQRGRDLGLGTLNETRKDLGLTPYTTFEQITNDAATVAAMKTAFGTPDNVDLWTGGLAEQHARGSLLGPTFTTIIADQFERLRDGDPFYFENALNRKDVRMVQNTTLSDIITRNTDATNMQADVFMNVPREVETDQTI